MTDSNRSSTTQGLNYKDSGVDIDAGNALVENIKPIVKKTFRPEVLASIGGFGSLFELPSGRYQQPVLVAGTDGVGTKLKLALEFDQHDTIGIDLVAMCVNDVIVQGAEPLFFLDYFATGKLDVAIATRVISGIAKGCELSGAALVGGETAEMPGMYSNEDYDLAGFCVGIVEKAQIIDGHKVSVGDILIGIASSGPHANGYSLIRKIIEINQPDLAEKIGEQTLAQLLLKPTRIYVKSVLELINNNIDIHALAHITGGGLLDNIPRVLPANTCATLNTNSWPRLPIFQWLQEKGNINDNDMYRTFNCGLGMIVCVAPSQVEKTLDLLTQAGETAYIVGNIDSSTTTNPQVNLQ